ncbi:cysteine-tryptophan domain-containing zinc finger protein 3-like isoform X2 [Phoenix dactylifera]|uniref:Cysteine-tryptophan domain-containing zinc finger protein 3-like isoform X2 n=1 Tax=Phoenix dactylifera TaxID=42345 RepID=A0A8B8ZFG9_PHODC|nr:cysteine-tryptophan domain-containing zinc finger protein 3-like isoform X2 [Phoenix dactylifera]
MSHEDFNGPMFGEYGTFLPVYVRHPSASTRSRDQACPASNLPRKEGYGDYNTRHDPHILKLGAAGEYGHEQKSDDTTTSSDISYYPADCFDGSLVGFTLYEARNLRSSADRLKANGDEVEISEIYLHAGLKFLKGACLLECLTIPITRPRNAPVTFRSYNDAANLFKYCAETNEKNGKTEVAALAYKCMEVAYLRVAFALQHVCSSSQSTLYKGDTRMSWNFEPKNYNASHLKQLLSIPLHATAAMDASMRSRRALEHAIKHHSCTDGHETGSLSSVKKALDFSFYDVEEFVRLITFSLKNVGM